MGLGDFSVVLKGAGLWSVNHSQAVSLVDGKISRILHNEFVTVLE